MAENKAQCTRDPCPNLPVQEVCLCAESPISPPPFITTVLHFLRLLVYAASEGLAYGWTLCQEVHNHVTDHQYQWCWTGVLGKNQRISSAVLFTSQGWGPDSRGPGAPGMGSVGRSQLLSRLALVLWSQKFEDYFGQALLAPWSQSLHLQSQAWASSLQRERSGEPSVEHMFWSYVPPGLCKAGGTVPLEVT